MLNAKRILRRMEFKKKLYGTEYICWTTYSYVYETNEGH